MLILGIETSCDETAAAVVDSGHKVLSNVVLSQNNLHALFGGVVPEIASRAHVEKISLVVSEAMQCAGVKQQDLTAIAVTHRPGLVGALLVGLTAAKSLAMAWQLPLVGVDHLEAHLYAGFMVYSNIPCPAAGLLTSGGHTSLYHINSKTEFRCLGGTIDDAVGEAFDKVANLLGLGYPGGPKIEHLAKEGDSEAISFPQSFSNEDGFRLSFSGLKTAVLYEAMGRTGPRDDHLLSTIPQRRKADIAASFQKAAVSSLMNKLSLAADKLQAQSILIGGGVACNSLLRSQVQHEGAKRKLTVVIPPASLCTDNAAMVAGLGAHLLNQGKTADLATLDAFPKT